MHRKPAKWYHLVLTQTHSPRSPWPPPPPPKPWPRRFGRPRPPGHAWPGPKHPVARFVRFDAQGANSSKQRGLGFSYHEKDGWVHIATSLFDLILSSKFWVKLAFQESGTLHTSPFSLPVALSCRISRASNGLQLQEGWFRV